MTKNLRIMKLNKLNRYLTFQDLFWNIQKWGKMRLLCFLLIDNEVHFQFISSLMITKTFFPVSCTEPRWSSLTADYYHYGVTAVADIIAVNSKRKVNQLNVQLLPHYFAQNLQQNLSSHNFSFTLAKVKLTIFKVTIFEIVNRISKKPSGPIN